MVGLVEPGNHAEGGGFPATAGAQECEDFTTLCGQRDAANCVHVGELRVEVAEFEKAHR